MFPPVEQRVRLVSSRNRTPTNVSSTAVDIPLKAQPLQPMGHFFPKRQRRTLMHVGYQPKRVPARQGPPTATELFVTERRCIVRPPVPQVNDGALPEAAHAVSRTRRPMSRRNTLVGQSIAATAA